MAKDTPEIRQLEQEIRIGISHLRFNIHIVKKTRKQTELKQHKAVYKVIKDTRKIYTITEFENMINEMAGIIQDEVTMMFLMEDAELGNAYYFDDCVIQPNQELNLCAYLHSRLTQFPMLANAEGIFMDMNRQYANENGLVDKQDQLYAMRQELKA